MKCRFCSQFLDDQGCGSVFLDLGTAPPSNAFLSRESLDEPELWFPLKLLYCSRCWLVQIAHDPPSDELFTARYPYFSSYSSTWLEHAREFATHAISRLSLDASGLVVEVGSNDGYLLQYFLERGIPCFGVEPTANTAAISRKRGIETINEFFGASLAQQIRASRGAATLLVANNVLAHVPDPGDFVRGLKIMLAPEGLLSIEFPHLARMVESVQFDTVYHEHYSYFSLHTASLILRRNGLRLTNVEVLPTHGGSLRLWACHDDARWPVDAAVSRILEQETADGLSSADYYSGFQEKADSVKNGLIGFLLAQRSAGLRVVGYGAAAKGNTLINYAGIRRDLLSFVADASPHKQGLYLPGSRIPVVSEDLIREHKPDVVLVLPWNLKDEISAQLAYVREWGGALVVAVPSVTRIM